MKILFILGFPNPYPGAAWSRVGFFAEAWSKKGNRIDVLGAFSYKAFQKRRFGKFGEVNIFNFIFNLQLNHPLVFIINSTISFIVSTFFLIAKRPSIAIVSLPMSGYDGLGTLMACCLTRVKYVVDYRDEWEDYVISITKSKFGKFFYSIVKKFLTRFYAKSQLVTTVTPNFVDSLRSRGVNNVRLVPNGADVTVFKPYDKTIIRRKLGLNNNDFIVVYNGLIGGYYKFDTILTALAKLRNQTKNVKLLMIGDGPDVSKVFTLSKNLGLRENVVYLGVKKDKKEIAEILSAGDVGIIPGLYTSGQLPVKLFEYGACGLPIVANVPSNSIPAKLIIEYEIGVTAPPFNKEKLAEALRNIYGNKSFRVAAGKRARLLIEEKFDRNKFVAEFLDLVREFA